MRRYRKILLDTLEKFYREELLHGKISSITIPLLDAIEDNIEYCISIGDNELKDKLEKVAESAILQCTQYCMVFSDFDKPKWELQDYIDCRNTSPIWELQEEIQCDPVFDTEPIWEYLEKICLEADEKPNWEFVSTTCLNSEPNWEFVNIVCNSDSEPNWMVVSTVCLENPEEPMWELIESVCKEYNENPEWIFEKTECKN